jgi:hypothetical protein
MQNHFVEEVGRCGCCVLRLEGQLGTDISRMIVLDMVGFSSAFEIHRSGKAVNPSDIESDESVLLF